MIDERWSGVPVAWAAVAPNGQPMWLGYDRPADATAVPLYRHPKPPLTDAEREAMEFLSTLVWPKASQQCKARSATLRGLLERMK
jgi:hypothetical protein